jgi:hypothetical protein
VRHHHGLEAGPIQPRPRLEVAVLDPEVAATVDARHQRRRRVGRCAAQRRLERELALRSLAQRREDVAQVGERHLGRDQLRLDRRLGEPGSAQERAQPGGEAQVAADPAGAPAADSERHRESLAVPAPVELGVEAAHPGRDQATQRDRQVDRPGARVGLEDDVGAASEIAAPGQVLAGHPEVEVTQRHHAAEQRLVEIESLPGRDVEDVGRGAHLDRVVEDAAGADSRRRVNVTRRHQLSVSDVEARGEVQRTQPADPTLERSDELTIEDERVSPADHVQIGGQRAADRRQLGREGLAQPAEVEIAGAQARLTAQRGGGAPRHVAVDAHRARGRREPHVVRAHGATLAKREDAAFCLDWQAAGHRLEAAEAHAHAVVEQLHPAVGVAGVRPVGAAHLESHVGDAPAGELPARAEVTQRLAAGDDLLGVDVDRAARIAGDAGEVEADDQVARPMVPEAELARARLARDRHGAKPDVEAAVEIEIASKIAPAGERSNVRGLRSDARVDREGLAEDAQVEREARRHPCSRDDGGKIAAQEARGSASRRPRRRRPRDRTTSRAR